MKLPDLVGLVVFAQPADRSRPIRPYIVLTQEDTRLQVMSAEGGILSSQIESVHFSHLGEWTLIGYQLGNNVMHELLAELTEVLENTSLTLTDAARAETVRTREALIRALDYRMREQRIEAREAEDTGIAAKRAKEDQTHAQLIAAVSADPSPTRDSFAERPFGTGVDIDVVIRAPNEEVMESTKERLRAALRGAHFNF